MEDMAKQYDSPEFKKSMEDVQKSLRDLSPSYGDDSSFKYKKAGQIKVMKSTKENIKKAAKEKREAFNYQEQAKKDQVEALKTKKEAQKDQAEKKFDYKKSQDVDIRIDEGKQDTSKNHQ